MGKCNHAKEMIFLMVVIHGLDDQIHRKLKRNYEELL